MKKIILFVSILFAALACGGGKSDKGKLAVKNETNGYITRIYATGVLDMSVNVPPGGTATSQELAPQELTVAVTSTIGTAVGGATIKAGETTTIRMTSSGIHYFTGEKGKQDHLIEKMEIKSENENKNEMNSSNEMVVAEQFIKDNKIFDGTNIPTEYQQINKNIKLIIITN